MKYALADFPSACRHMRVFFNGSVGARRRSVAADFGEQVMFWSLGTNESCFEARPAGGAVFMENTGSLSSLLRRGMGTSAGAGLTAPAIN